MKAPDPHIVEKVNARTKANARIDEAIKTGKRHSADPFDIDMLDKVMRPFSMVLIEERYRPDSDPNIIRDAVCSFTANMANEMIMQVAERDDPAEAVKQARVMLGLFSDFLTQCLQVNYGLTAAQVRGMVESTPTRS